MKIGVLSDTHGVLYEEVEEQLRGCDVILHAGDFDRPAILERLRAIARVIAVRGNCDWDLTEDLPDLQEFTLGGKRIVMAHKPYDLPRNLRKYDLAICGHTHRYAEAMEEGTLLLNPGSVSRPRGGGPTMAIVTIENREIRIKRIEI